MIPAPRRGDLAIDSITPEELNALLRRGQAPVILDVRNLDEVAICRLPGSKVIPLAELPDRLGELDPTAPMVVHCKSGGRSQRAIAFLEQQGFARLKNLSGGILAWIRDVDPSLQSY
ncbi:MAG: rhodanese-like domain-containing protein [Isosphaeraceae bacterium]